MLYDYSRAITMINTLFNPKLERLFRTVPTTIANSYYVAKGIKIDGLKSCRFSLDNKAISSFSSNIQGNNDHIPDILLIKSKDIISKDIIYIGSKLTILCFVPEDIIDDSFDEIDRIEIVHNIFEYIIENTCPNIDDLSILGWSLKYLADYLTILTFKTWYTGFTFEKYSKAMARLDKVVYEKYFNNFMELDDPHIDYSKIYALTH